MLTHFVLAGHAGVDGDHEDDAKDDSHDGGGEVVDDSTESNFAREWHVERPNCRDQRGNDQRKYESLQHPEEDLPDVGDVHDLPLVPLLLALAQDQAEPHPAYHAAHRGYGQGVHPQTSSGFLHSTHPEE